MGIAGQNFLGRNYYLPGSYWAFRGRARQSAISDDLGTIKIIADSDNGNHAGDLSLPEEDRFYTFADFPSAKRILKKGKLLDAIKLAFNPSTAPGFENGAQFVKAFNVNSNTKAVASLGLTPLANKPYILWGLGAASAVDEALIAALSKAERAAFPFTQSYTPQAASYVVFAFDAALSGELEDIQSNDASVFANFTKSKIIHQGRELTVYVSNATIAAETEYVFTAEGIPAPMLLDLKASVPGPAGNQIALRKNIAQKTIELRASNFSETSRKLEWPVFALSYTGSETDVHLGIDSESLSIIENQNTHTASLAELENLANLVAFLNSLDGFQAEVLADTSFDLSRLDHISKAELGAAAQTFYADAESEKLYLEGSGLVSVEYPTHKRPLAGSIQFGYLSGGATGVAQTGSYTQAMDLAETTGGLFCNLLSTSLTDKILFRDSIIRLNSPDGAKECLGGVGASLSDTENEARSEARSLNSRFLVYGLSSFMTYDGDGIAKDMDGTLLSVLHHAIMAAQNTQTPTAKALNIIKPLKRHKDTASILRDGALVLDEQIIAGTRSYGIVRALTTEQSQNLIYNESTSVLKGLIMVKELRETMNANFVGAVSVDPTSAVDGPTPADIRSVFELKMDEFVRRGFLFGAGGVPAWYRDDYKLILDGDSYYFEDVRGNVSLPINFIFGLLELEALRTAA